MLSLHWQVYCKENIQKIDEKLGLEIANKAGIKVLVLASVKKFDQLYNIDLKVIDPIADKLLISAALLALVYLEVVETWIAAIIILREIFFLAFRFYFFVKDSQFSASWLAKKKTLSQIISISILIIYPKVPVYSDFVKEFGTWLLYYAAFLTVYSGIEYLIKFSKNLKGKSAV